jgi:hypothetical protein
MHLRLASGEAFTLAQMEAHVFGDGNSSIHYSNGPTAKRYREETEEERATYRKWMRGIVVFYCVLALVTGLLAAVNYSGAGFTQRTHLSGRPAATSPRAD